MATRTILSQPSYIHLEIVALNKGHFAVQALLYVEPVELNTKQTQKLSSTGKN